VPGPIEKTSDDPKVSAFAYADSSFDPFRYLLHFARFPNNCVWKTPGKLKGTEQGWSFSDANGMVPAETGMVPD